MIEYLILHNLPGTGDFKLGLLPFLNYVSEKQQSRDNNLFKLDLNDELDTYNEAEGFTFCQKS